MMEEVSHEEDTTKIADALQDAALTNVTQGNFNIESQSSNVLLLIYILTNCMTSTLWICIMYQILIEGKAQYCVMRVQFQMWNTLVLGSDQDSKGKGF